MKQLVLRCVCLLSMLVPVLAPILPAAETEPRFLTIIADWGDQGIPADVIESLRRHPSLRLAAVWPRGLKPSVEAEELVREGRLEPVLALENEPVLPLVYETLISSPAAVAFSRPEDVGDIVFRNQEEFRQIWGRPASGMYLRSGAFSPRLVPVMQRLGLSWVNIIASSGTAPGVSRDGFLCFPQGEEPCAAPGACVAAAAASRPGAFNAVFFTRTNPLTADFIEEFAAALSAQAPDVEPALPGTLAGRTPDPAEDSGPMELESDLTPWLRRPVIWYDLAGVRKAVEDYQNSGRANVSLLEALRGELYRLYRYDFLLSLQEAPKAETEQMYQAAVSNIYRLLGQPVPPLLDDIRIPGAASSSFLVEKTTDALHFTVPFEGVRRIRGFSVSVTDAGTVFRVSLEEAAMPPASRVDIYIDLNNLRGAGSTMLLPGVSGFVRPQDAWEFALRIENGAAVLYRSGRQEPFPAGRFQVGSDGAIFIPKDVLRGGPLLWGYQVVALDKIALSSWKIADILNDDGGARDELLGNPLPHLRLFRCSR